MVNILKKLKEFFVILFYGAASGNIRLKRAGFTVTLSPYIYYKIKELGYSVYVAKVNGVPASVQLTHYHDGVSEYIGTIRNFFNIKGFKDGDVTNFSESNLIYKTERK